MKYKVMLDGNRYSFLVLNWGPEIVEVISMAHGIIEIGKIPTDMCAFLVDTDRDPADLARIYLGTTLDKTPQAVRVLRSILGIETGPEPVQSAPRVQRATNPNALTLSNICQEHGFEPSDARRILRKMGKKPGEHWEWEPQHIPEIVEILKSKLENIKPRS